MKNKNLNAKEIDEIDYIETPRELLVDKLAMLEMLNAEDFNILFKLLQDEFNRTFAIPTKLEEEKEIE